MTTVNNIVFNTDLMYFFKWMVTYLPLDGTYMSITKYTFQSLFNFKGQVT